VHRNTLASSAALVACTTAAIASCRAPTEIKVVVTTDFDCADLKDVTVTVGTLGDALESDPPTSTSTTCSAGSVGTIVVVPSGSDHADVGIKVVGGFGVKQAEACAPAPGSSPPEYGVGCIVARRAIDFTPHTPLTVPIVLRAACNGIACGETETCDKGQCVPAEVPDSSACAAAGGCPEPDVPDAATGSDYCTSLPALPVAPVIDGVVDDDLPLVDVTPVGWTGGATPPDATTQYAVAWRPDGIYFFVRVHDPSLVPAEASEQAWQGDAVELFADSDGRFSSPPAYDNPGTRHFIVAAPSSAASSAARGEVGS